MHATSRSKFLFSTPTFSKMQSNTIDKLCAQRAKNRGSPPRMCNPICAKDAEKKDTLSFQVKLWRIQKSQVEAIYFCVLTVLPEGKESKSWLKKRMHGNAHVKEIIIVATCNASCTPRKPANDGGQEKTKALQRTTWIFYIDRIYARGAKPNKP